MNNDYKMLVMATTEQEEKVTRGLKKRENNWWREMMRKWESAFFIEKRLIVSFPDEKIQKSPITDKFVNAKNSYRKMSAANPSNSW